MGDRDQSGITPTVLSGEGAIGEAQVTPTTYTLLDRLKTIATNLGAVVLTTGSAIIGKVGIDQTTLGTTNGVVRTGGGLSNSGVKSADAAVKATAGKVYWVSVSDTAALAVEINDSTANGGTDVWAIDLPAGGYGLFIFDPPIDCAIGIYLDVSTATCKVVVGYK